MAKVLKESYPGLPVVPVPARRRRIRERGWDHMQQISYHISKRHAVKIYRCLARKGDIPQKALNFEQRLRNIASSAISFVPKAAPPPRTDEVVLIDDIFTTGATVDECSRILLSEGIRRVYVLTFAQD
jgi:predicted amidophosphoribosyltransferase